MQQDLSEKPELLAPAGTRDAVEAVLQAGADAVYVGGKKFNMRQHRTSYNLTEEDIIQAIELAHQQEKKLYYTLNNMLFESELDEVRDLLRNLGQWQPDAIIVQDLAVASMAREICVHIPLHASTMMNIHSIEAAETLKMMGFTRIITSRDIPLHEVRRIAEGTGLEMEYFIHGDMCIAQSAQCYLSGQVFAESSNRGRCMKPCRWDWTLESENGRLAPELKQGYLLARKDMCLLPYIPELVQNKIASFKIEGRMRSAEFLAPIVELYRRAIDEYFADPLHYRLTAEDWEAMLSLRVRNYCSCNALDKAGAESVDPTGKREPRFFSRSAPESLFTATAYVPDEPLKQKPELIVHVCAPAGADAAIRAGADAIYLGGDEFAHYPRRNDLELTLEFLSELAQKNIRTVWLSPRITDERDIAEWRWWLRRLRSFRSLGVGVSNLGALQVAYEMRFREVVADFSFNTSNSVAADELSTLGATRVTASTELEFQLLQDFTERSRLPVEVVGQGPMPGMLLEYCVISAACEPSNGQPCTTACLRENFALRDQAGHTYPVKTDRRCRNHIFLPGDVCILPHLGQFAQIGVSGIRIEAQCANPETIEVIVSTYRQALDALAELREFDAAVAAQKLMDVTHRPLIDGAFAFDSMAMNL